MKGRKLYDIDIFSLSNKKHSYEYHLKDDFFSLIEESLVKKGNLNVSIELDKSDTMIQANFKINGIIEQICDRSGDPFDFDINLKDRLIFKYGDSFSELSDEIVLIPRSAQKLNVTQYLYEFVALAVPMKKIHPKFEDNNYLQNDESILIYSTEDIDAKKEEANDIIDPRWSILNKLKLNNN